MADEETTAGTVWEYTSMPFPYEPGAVITRVLSPDEPPPPPPRHSRSEPLRAIYIRMQRSGWELTKADFQPKRIDPLTGELELPGGTWMLLWRRAVDLDHE